MKIAGLFFGFDKRLKHLNDSFATGGYGKTPNPSCRINIVHDMGCWVPMVCGGDTLHHGMWAGSEKPIIGPRPVLTSPMRQSFLLDGRVQDDWMLAQTLVIWSAAATTPLWMRG